MADFSYWQILTRRKILSSNANQESNLKRVMNTFDLTTLGVGATLGVGVYVLAGHVSRDQAGPSVILSFAIAAITSLLAGLCYAEFGARVPRAGSAYIYSYVCIGELVAFIVGWNLILEYIIGSASVSKGISLYLDTLINDTLKTAFIEITPINWGFLGLYFDWFAFATAFVFGVCLAFGIRTSTIINNLLTVLNVIIVVIVIVAGAFKADIKNWQIDPAFVNVTTNKNLGSGGFFPFGIEGTFKGAATCFFGFVGFDSIATTGEEVKDPQRAIPKSILFTLVIIFVAYFSVATVLTLMWPYYLQDVNAPLPFVFQEIGWPALKWIVTIGGMIGLIASLFGAMFPLPRILYAMSQDGLVFRFLGKISKKFQTPVTGTMCAAFLTGIMSGIFELTQLVNMLSIGTLLAYTVVAISITMLRFMNNLNDSNAEKHLNGNSNRITPGLILKQLINCKRIKTPNILSTRIVGTVLFFYCLCCFAFSLMIIYVPNEIFNLQPWAVGITSILLITIFLLLFIISMQPREEIQPEFKVPFIPIIPGISIFVNIYLMLQLDIYTWIRFGIWMLIGFIIYMACLYLYKTIEFENNSRKTRFQISNDKASNNKYENKIQRDQTTQDVCDTNVEDTQSLAKSSTKQCLDEIILEAEPSHNHEKIKNANGRTCFMENSIIPENEKKGNEEDAKSAIAILDDILKKEESITKAHELNEFHRKPSVKLIPPFIEASTIAIVHKSCDSLPQGYENWNEKISKSDKVENNDFIILNIKREEDILILNNCESFKSKIQFSVKSDNVELSTGELHKNDLLLELIKQKNQINIENKYSEHIESEQMEKHSYNYEKFSDGNNLKNLDNATIENEQKHINCFDKDEDKDQIVNPIHSKTFMDKLNKLISKRTLLTIESRRYLKSEKTNLNAENVVLEEFIAENKEKYKNENSQNVINGNSIPTAPKFNPILNNALGTLDEERSESCDRFEILSASSPQDDNAENTDISATVRSSSISFKMKLETVLMRGPAYKIRNNSTPIVIESNIKSNKHSNIDVHKEKYKNVLKTLNDRTQISKRWKLLDPSRPVTIEEALKQLKPVKPVNKITSTTN